jgi:hypothetical protein
VEEDGHDFSHQPETEARLLAKAQEQGVSIDALLEQLMNETEAPPAANGKAPELPAWHLGTKSSLRRCDIYDDVR